MSVLDNLISISVKYGTFAPSTPSFGVPLIVAPFLTTSTTVNFSTRTRKYSSLLDMAADGWSTSSAVYLAAKAVFAQSPSVPYIVVGRRQMVESTPTVLTADADWATAFAAIQAEADNWYAVYPAAYVGSTVSAIATEQTQIAVWVEATGNKIAVLDTSDVTSLASTTTDIAYTLTQTKYNRVLVNYHNATSFPSEYLGAGLLGAVLTAAPGSINWAYKTPLLVSPDAVSQTQRTNALAKNCNLFMQIAGLNLTQMGKVAGGTYGYIDITQGVDWITANVQATVLAALAANDKIGFTDAGILAIVKLVKSVLLQAAGMGIVDASTIVVTAPSYADIPTADKQNRNLPNVRFSATLTGAINTVAVTGVVSL